MLWTYRADDAGVLVVAMGSIATEATSAVDALRERGIRSGVIGMRVFRPFPGEEVAQALGSARTVLVLERDLGYVERAGWCFPM